jgi:hypothetical protein
VWEVLQGQFEKTQGLNIPLNSSSLQQSSDAEGIQYYQSGNGKQDQYFANQENGNNTQIHFITNGGSIGNGHNGSDSSNGNKTVMDQNGRKIVVVFIENINVYYIFPMNKIIFSNLTFLRVIKKLVSKHFTYY